MDYHSDMEHRGSSFNVPVRECWLACIGATRYIDHVQETCIAGARGECRWLNLFLSSCRKSQKQLKFSLQNDFKSKPSEEPILLVTCGLPVLCLYLLAASSTGFGDVTPVLLIVLPGGKAVPAG